MYETDEIAQGHVAVYFSLLITSRSYIKPIINVKLPASTCCIGPYYLANSERNWVRKQQWKKTDIILIFTDSNIFLNYCHNRVASNNVIN